MKHIAVGACLAVWALVLAVPAPASACPDPPRTVQISTAVYGSDATFEALDLYLPAATSGEPIILFAHGGDWTRGDKAQYRELGERFAGCGVAFAALDYPLAPPAHADAQAADLDKAVKWALDNAAAKRYARTKLFLMGHGSGAELAALAALDAKLAVGAGMPPGAIAGVIAVDGEAYDPSQDASAVQADPGRMRAYAAAFGDDPAGWKDYDCSQFMKGSEPRFLVVHGVDDSIASPAYSTAFVQELKDAHDRVIFLQPDGRDYRGVLVSMVQDPLDPVFGALMNFVSGP
ncbi:MAG TPA: alpha/beta hydrolase [Candidatus Eremiobacteraceae bacterium]|nr:alpha/beta hydrolase [Candidatus Eremiobacteraceae bacterium]